MTRSVVRSLCQQGETVHLVCQENHPERYDFIAEVFRYTPEGAAEHTLKRKVPFGGRCILHKPTLGDTLPVYVPDHYEEFSNVVPMVDLPTHVIENYLDRNVRVVQQVVETYGLAARGKST